LSETNFETSATPSTARKYSRREQTNTLPAWARPDSNVLARCAVRARHRDHHDLNVSKRRGWPAVQANGVRQHLQHYRRYDARLSSGQKVSESLTALTDAIDDLEAQTTALIGASES
jgi:hypothetical protein